MTHSLEVSLYCLPVGVGQARKTQLRSEGLLVLALIGSPNRRLDLRLVQVMHGYL